MDHILVPAYGRDYETEEEVLEAYESGKDFVYMSIGRDRGRYCSIRDFNELDCVKLRYNQKEEIVFTTGRVS